MVGLLESLMVLASPFSGLAIIYGLSFELESGSGELLSWKRGELEGDRGHWGYWKKSWLTGFI